MLLQYKGKNNSNIHKGAPLHNRPSQRNGPRAAFSKKPLGTTDQEVLDVAVQMYRGQYEAAPSILPGRLQDQFMAKLHEELGKHLVTASLWSALVTAQSLSRGGGTHRPTLHPELGHP